MHDGDAKAPSVKQEAKSEYPLLFVVGDDFLTFIMLGYRIKVAFPRWFMNRAWDLQVLFATCGWNVAFQQYTIVEEGNELFF